MTGNLDKQVEQQQTQQQAVDDERQHVHALDPGQEQADTQVGAQGPPQESGSWVR